MGAKKDRAVRILRPDRVTGGLPNQTLLSDYLCSTCWGRLTERWVVGVWLVSCHKGCTPGGFVTQYWVAQCREKDVRDAREVAAAYPELAPPRLKRSQQ
jgi:hypothetical protein